MKKFVFPLILLFGIMVSSCTSMLYTSIDVLRPAKVTFEKDAKSLLIVNNSVSQPASYGHTNELAGEKKKNVSVNTDSLAIFCLSVVNEEFQKNDFFNQTNLNLETINDSGSFLIASSPKMDKLNDLSQKYDADVVLSLDKIKVNDRVSDFYNNETGKFYALFEANFESAWTVSYPKLNKSQSYNFKDTIYWEEENYLRKKALETLPKRYNALIDGALYVGQNTMKKLVPWWDKDDRYFFKTNNKYMKEGLDSVYVKNWSSAISIWKNGLSKSGIATQAKLLHNIATAYEIKGDMINAKLFNQKAIDTYESSTIMDYNHYITMRLYNQTLEKRQKEIETINRQLGVN